jgi:DNA polymerase
MAAMTDLDSLSALAWLVESGADEAVLEAPVDRFVAPKAPAAAPPELRTPAAVHSPTSRRVESPSARRAASPVAALPAGSESTAATAARCNTLAELKAALEAFDECALKKGANRTVFADGNPEGGLMCIGEAPGHDEDRAGLPFVGRAGKLLDRMLAAIGRDRSNTYIANVLPWRPPENRNPEPTEVAKCIPFLRRHIELARPTLLILLGAVAARHVVGAEDGILRLRGKWLEYIVDGAPVPVMPTLHPAYLLRRPVDKKLAWRDLQAVRDRLAERG